MPQKIAYLTIDDSPTQDFLPKLNYLISKGIPAIWFSIGANMELHPESVIAAIQQGYPIGNHSYSHPHFSEITLDKAYEEIQRTDAIIEDLYARAEVQRPAKYFRFPYGDKGALTGSDVYTSLTEEGQQRKTALQTYLRGMGYMQPTWAGVTYDYFEQYGLRTDVDWYWTYDCMEWSVFQPQPYFGIDSAEKVYARMDENVPEGGRGLNDSRSEEIILLHDHVQTTDIFEAIIERLLAKGLEFRAIRV